MLSLSGRKMSADAQVWGGAAATAPVPQSKPSSPAIARIERLREAMQRASRVVREKRSL
jgi:hypothetical protein